MEEWKKLPLKAPEDVQLWWYGINNGLEIDQGESLYTFFSPKPKSIQE